MSHFNFNTGSDGSDLECQVRDENVSVLEWLESHTVLDFGIYLDTLILRHVSTPTKTILNFQYWANFQRRSNFNSTQFRFEFRIEVLRCLSNTESQILGKWNVMYLHVGLEEWLYEDHARGVTCEWFTEFVVCWTRDRCSRSCSLWILLEKAEIGLVCRMLSIVFVSSNMIKKSLRRNINNILLQ